MYGGCADMISNARSSDIRRSRSAERAKKEDDGTRVAG
jgi:hypothetical protein